MKIKLDTNDRGEWQADVLLPDGRDMHGTGNEPWKALFELAHFWSKQPKPTDIDIASAENESVSAAFAFAAATVAGRKNIAVKARADGEEMFAREVLAGAWDHRNDVKNAIAEVLKGMPT